MFNIKCIIVEDEPLAVKILKEHISEVPYLELIGTFKDAILASDFLRENKVDLIFLDIHLPKLKGMAFLKTLNNPPAVIITTAYHQYAVEGFDLNVTDYLLKPIEFERFLTAVGKVKGAAGNKELLKKEYIFVNVHNRKVKIPFADILYVESQREYVKIVTGKNTYLTKMSTTDIEELLPADRFKRIHRSFIVSIDKIESYSAKTLTIGSLSIPIGRGYSEIIDKLLK